MLVITVQEEEEEKEGREKKETLHGFRSLVKLGSRGVALCDDKQSRALCVLCLCLSQTTAWPKTLPRCVLSPCLLSIVQHANL